MQIKTSLVLLFFTITCGLIHPLQSGLAQSAPPTTRHLATVNEVAITRLDLTMEMAQLQSEMKHRNRPLSARQITRLRRQIIDNLINRELLYQRAQQMKIKIRNSWIEKALVELKAQFGSDKAYDAFLARAGIAEAQLKSHIAKGLIVRRLLRREVIRPIKVSEAEMQAFFREHPEFFQTKEQIRARHILVSFNEEENPASRSDARLRIHSIQMMLAEGSNFASLAIEYSDDPSKSRGGDLGYFDRDHMVRPFSKVAFRLNPGEISDIVETQFGYHLIQVLDRIPPSQMAYRNARDKIERTLRRNKEKAAAEKYLAKLKHQASIVR